MEILKLMLQVLIFITFVKEGKLWRRRRSCDSTPCAWVWDPCNVTCGGGIQYSRITRNQGSCGSCNRPISQPCNQQCCRVDCEWGPWTNWTSCSHTCGGGLMARHRNVTVEATCDGSLCTGNYTESHNCSTECCAVDCVWSIWSTWSSCPSSCDPHNQTRSRNFSIENECGGKECVGDSYENKDCDVKQYCQEGSTANLFNPLEFQLGIGISVPVVIAAIAAVVVLIKLKGRKTSTDNATDNTIISNTNKNESVYVYADTVQTTEFYEAGKYETSIYNKAPTYCELDN